MCALIQSSMTRSQTFVSRLDFSVIFLAITAWTERSTSGGHDCWQGIECSRCSSERYAFPAREVNYRCGRVVLLTVVRSVCRRSLWKIWNRPWNTSSECLHATRMTREHGRNSDSATLRREIWKARSRLIAGLWLSLKAMGQAHQESNRFSFPQAERAGVWVTRGIPQLKEKGLEILCFLSLLTGASQRGWNSCHSPVRNISP